MSNKISPVTTTIEVKAHGQTNSDQKASDNQGPSPYEELRNGILYLNSLRSDIGVQGFLNEAKKLMEKLTTAFKHEEANKAFLPWVKFFDVAYKAVGNFDEREDFQNGMSDIVHSLLLAQKDPKQGLDWRIARKMVGVKVIFSDVEALIPQDQDYFGSLKLQLQEALDFLDWAKDQESLARRTIQNLLKLFEDKSEETQEELLKAIIAGRFDKEVFSKFGIQDTVILGEDGGLYLLINSLNGAKDQEKKVFIEKEVGKEYLKDKIKHEGKVIIGKGGFGTVRFALNLLEGVRKPGDVICLKKSRSYETIRKKDEFMSPIETITDNTLGDYFTNDLAGVLYAPKVVDMAIVSQRDLEPCHKKGYLMMEIAPQNTGNKIFNPAKRKITEYQKWEHQKPYILDVLRGMITLHEYGVAMTDLKPENSLYDTDLRQATIIDLGGTVKPKTKEEMTQFDPSKYDMQNTEGYAAPEMNTGELVDLPKSVAYSCGKVIEKVTEITDYPNKQEITSIINEMTVKDSNNRLSIEKAIERINAIGNDNYKEHIIFTHYINKVREQINTNNQSSLGLNDDIKQTRELLIPLEVAILDPYKYQGLEYFPFDQKIAQFFTNEQKKVFLLLGAAGSGKSIALQLKFLDAVQNWKLGDSLPIYFNLANGIDLEKVLERLNLLMKTGLSVQKNLQGKKIHLYVDSFDEGFYPDLGKKENLIKRYQELLGEENTKIFVSSRSDYSIEESWFYSNRRDALDQFYVAPLDFQNEEKLKGQIHKYLGRGIKKEKERIPIVDDYSKRIKHSGITINTGFMFYMVINALPDLKTKQRFTKEDVFQQYVQSHWVQIWENYNDKQREKVNNNLSEDLLQEMGNYLASELHTDKKYRLKQDTQFFKDFLNYKLQRDFQFQLGFHLLQLLPLKIEVTTAETNGRKTSTITVGFRHDIVKNYYLGQVIFKNKELNVLSSHNIGEDVELVKYLGEIVQTNPVYQKQLLEAILATKTKKTPSAVTHAANAMTILVAAKYSFSGMDLSNVSLKGANLSNGLFHKTNFTKADLTSAVLKNAYLNEAVFESTVMEDVDLGIFPDLTSHKEDVESLLFTPDGTTLISASRDKKIKVWNAFTGKEIRTLEGHTSYLIDAILTPDGKTVISCSVDKTIRTWDWQTGKELKTFSGHDSTVTSLSLSSDGRTLASSDYKKVIKLWDLEKGEELRTLAGHPDGVSEVLFHPNDKFLVSRSAPGIVKTWDVATGEELPTIPASHSTVAFVFSPDGKWLVTGTWEGGISIWDAFTRQPVKKLQGHFQMIKKLLFSPDGKMLVSSSDDKTVKLWEIETGKELQTLEDNMGFETVGFSPDGKLLVTGSGDNGAKIWDSYSGKELQNLQGHESSVKKVVFSPDGKTLATASTDKKIKIWDISTSKEFQTVVGHGQDVVQAIFSPDDKAVLSLGSDSIVKEWDPATGKEMQTYSGHRFYCQNVCYVPDSKKLVFVSYGREPKIWDPATGKKLQEFKGHKSDVGMVVFSPDGKKIATGSGDKTAKVWDVETGKELKSFAHQGALSIDKVLWAPDGRSLASASWSNVFLWDVQTGEEIKRFEHSSTVISIAFSPDGKTIAAGSIYSKVMIWNIESGEELHVLEGHISNVKAVVYSPDGKVLVSGAYDKTVKIWDPVTGKELQTLNGHTGIINTLEFSQDGRRLVSTSNDEALKIWEREEEVQSEEDKKVGYVPFVQKKNISRKQNLMAVKMIIDEAVNLSERNELIFGQRGCVTKRNAVQKDVRKEKEAEGGDLKVLIFSRFFEQLQNFRQNPESGLKIGHNFKQKEEKGKIGKPSRIREESKEKKEGKSQSFWGRLFACGGSKR